VSYASIETVLQGTQPCSSKHVTPQAAVAVVVSVHRKGRVARARGRRPSKGGPGLPRCFQYQSSTYLFFTVTRIA
jgi:hypothetical protein